ncbi:hypothetical protein [Yersinia hibernica]|uniref:N-acetylglucosamine-binding protein A n=1 Tax=Yersinia enterocolitica LC20 TaxID=1443113 RepID=A0A7U4K240_YEREN|nr:hypothetical protein [Yersinia hibernica]AHM75387.2 hypothetical protein LC20_04134 [Yersinia hibernica]OVZ83292.1 hypothetical protein CBW54_16310 [Yersinia kristensenii]
MINIIAVLLHSIILFSPLASSSLNGLFSSAKAYNAVTAETGQLQTMVAKQEMSRLVSFESDIFPDFNIEFTGSYYNKDSAEYEISFTLESQGMLNYSVYIVNDSDMEMDNDAGYINNNKKNIKLKMSSVQPGTYQLIIEIADNKKETKVRTRTITII